MSDDTLHLPKRRLCWFCNSPLAKKSGTDEVSFVTILTRDGHPVKVHGTCEEHARQSQKDLTADVPEALRDHGGTHVTPRYAEGEMGVIAEIKAQHNRRKK